jgi:hypothetical protein
MNDATGIHARKAQWSIGCEFSVSVEHEWKVSGPDCFNPEKEYLLPIKQTDGLVPEPVSVRFPYRESKVDSPIVSL